MPTANSLKSKPRPIVSMGMKPVDPSKLRIETVKNASKPTIVSSVSTSRHSAPRASLDRGHDASRGLNVRKKVPARASPSSNGLLNTKDPVRSARSSASKRSSSAVTTPSAPMFGSDDDESDSDDEQTARKRRKLEKVTNMDASRSIYNEEAFADGAAQLLDMVHAADIAYAGTAERPNAHFHNFFAVPEVPDQAIPEHFVEIQYPSTCNPERYNLVAPREKDDFKPIDEMIRVMTAVAQHYLQGSNASFIADKTSGLLFKLRRAIKRDNVADFHQLVADYNDFLLKLVKDGTIYGLLRGQTSPLPLSWVEQVLTQTYSRTVSLRVESLRRYENGTDNVYGELLPRFVSDIFRETKLKSSHIFVDLGSGVGNVVLQAALEIGCESWGCEMMPNACDLAEIQEKEFVARCRLWGLKPGPVKLERGDFLTNTPTLSILKRADVVLINNQAFTPSLNDKLIMHFLDLKEGCQIVSLKSFVPQGHKIQPRNVDSPVNLLVDRELRYYSDSVSWTDAPGTYHIARKDRKSLEDFIAKEMS